MLCICRSSFEQSTLLGTNPVEIFRESHDSDYSFNQILIGLSYKYCTYLLTGKGSFFDNVHQILPIIDHLPNLS